MRILLDECAHAGVRAAFPGHAVRTVTQAGWRGGKDAPLLKFANRISMSSLLLTESWSGRTIYRGRSYRSLKVGIIIVHVSNNKLASYEPLFKQLFAAAEKVRSGEVVHLGRESR